MGSRTTPRDSLRTVRRTAPRPALPRVGRGYSREYLIAELRLWAAHHDGDAPRTCDWNRAHARRHGVTFEVGWPSTQAVANCFGSWRLGLEAAGLQPHTNGGNITRCSDCGQRTKQRRRCPRCERFLAEHGTPWTRQAARELAMCHSAEARARQSELARQRYQRLIALRREGQTNGQIAARLGVSTVAITAAFASARARGYDVPSAPPHARARGERAAKAKLTWEQVRTIRARVAAGETQAAMAQQFGVTQPTVSCLVRGRTWVEADADA